MTIEESSIGLCVEHVQSIRSILVSCSIIDDQNQCLYKLDVDLCSNVTVVDMSFNFDITCKELLLRIETLDENIREFPLSINVIKLDDLFTVPFIAHTGSFYNLDNIKQSDGNCLYAAGRLEYRFPLPFVLACNIV